VDKYLERLAAIDQRVGELLAGESLTQEQQAEYDRLVGADGNGGERAKLVAKIGQVQAQEERERQRLALEHSRAQAVSDQLRAQHTVAGGNRLSTPDAQTINSPASAVAAANLGATTIPAQVRDHAAEARCGYQTFGSFAMDVMNASISRRPSDRLLRIWDAERKNAAATGMGEAVGSDGGFLVPTEFNMKIMERVYESQSLLARCDRYNIGGNSIVFPRNAETSRANGSRWGGVRAYWLGEGSQGTGTKPTLGRLTLNLHKLMTIGVMTDELISDAGPVADQYMNKCFAAEIDFAVGDSLVNGTGSGQPMGILSAACTVSVAKETGQAAATISATNVLKMWARMQARCRQNAVWLINQDTEPQLLSMQIGTGVANQVVYMPPGGLSAQPYATLMGRPVLPVEYCATLGTVGDIILVDLSQWVAVTKSSGPQSDVSMHFYFDTDQQAFRMVFRIDAQPWWASALTPYKGTATQAPAVTLATRS